MNKSLVNMFLDLVQIDSPSGSEESIVRHVGEILVESGINYKVDKAGNLYARVFGKGNPIVLSGHLDTVEPGRNVKPIIREDGLISSDGSTILGADNKAFIAALLSSLAKVKKKRNLEIVLSVREETDSGIKDFDFTWLRGKVGISADTGEPIGTIILATPWIEEFEIEIIGKSAHASIPHEAVNALKIAAGLLAKLKIGKVDSDTVMNIGVISGGDVTNTVPGKVVLRGELRSYSKLKFDKYLSLLEKKINEEVAKSEGRVIFRRKLYCSGYKYRRNSKHLTQISTTLKSLGHQPIFLNSMGGSDANTFIEKGINIINIGDGAKDLHTTNENITVKDLQRLEAIISKYISL